MPKTKTLEVSTSDEIRIKAYRNNVTVIVDDPQIEDMLSKMSSEDIIIWVQGEGYTPDEIFSEKELIKWAEENGFVKE